MKGEQRMSLDGIRIGFCMTGSFCTFEKAFAAAERLVQQGAKLVPIMSFNAASKLTFFDSSELKSPVVTSPVVSTTWK